ncbi:MAG: YegS/Rv2252/BmrU family lipid kinase [Vicingaceae bacterium]
MSRAKKIQFIINPNSGVNRKVKLVDLLKEELDPSFQYGIHFTKHPSHATELAQQAVDQGVEAVIAVGGDGSVNEVGKALIGTSVALGIIPSGSGNGFARHMGIPMRSRSAIQRINNFQSQTIDTANINGEPFLATAGLGFDAHVGWKFADFGRRGFLSYMQVSTHEFFTFKPKTYQLEIDGEKMETRAFLINFANAGQYGNNAWIAPSASISDGMLNVCILEHFPSHFVPDIIFKLFSKQIERSKYYRVIQAKEIRVLNPEHFHMDGEPRKSQTELIIRVNPSSLKVLV